MSPVRSRGERIREAAALSAVGGFLDAYTFLVHGGVFANAQTGNVVLFGVQAGAGDWQTALRHVPPILAFAAGIAAVETIAWLRRVRLFRRPARLVLATECVAFLVVGLVPMPDTLATIVIAFVATMQVGTFRSIGDLNYNTTFTTGNLRSLVAAAVAWIAERQRTAAGRTRTLASIVGSFAAGAVIGGFAARGLHDHAVLLTIPVLLLVLTSVVTGTARAERAAG